ncbi:hypothetical protein D3C87_1694920 [compost metagenome]
MGLGSRLARLGHDGGGHRWEIGRVLGGLGVTGGCDREGESVLGAACLGQRDAELGQVAVDPVTREGVGSFDNQGLIVEREHPRGFHERLEARLAQAVPQDGQRLLPKFFCLHSVRGQLSQEKARGLCKIDQSTS